MRERLKGVGLGFPGAANGWAAYRSAELHRDYLRRREHYHRLAVERGLTYSEPGVAAQVRQRLARRGWTPTPRRSGEVHTFAFIPRLGWHDALYPDLAELGPVTEFDYAALGYTPEEFQRGGRAAGERRREMNGRALEALRQAHARRPVDWVFIYASGLEVRAELVRAIVDELGVPVVNMCLDDKQSWTGPVLDGQRMGQVDIAAAFDLCWTSARVACEWYLVEGARPLYLPEGFTASIYHPMAVEQDLPVSFVGAAYGFRPPTIRHLRARGVAVHPFGPGWGTRSVWGREQVEVFNRSAINLGMGGIGYSPMLTNVKTRDFEITGTGGGVYLTSFSPDLAQHYQVGRELLCYRSDEEMVELIRHYLSHPDEAREIARLGRARSLAEHRWLHRYQTICRTLGILGEAEP